MTTTTRNESAERLQDWINGDDPREWKAAQPNKWLDEALAAERRATVERIRVRLERIGADLPIGTFGGVYLVLDEEAAR